MDEDMILPDDFQADTTPEETTEPEQVETVEETTPAEETETSQETHEVPPFLKVKYNKEELTLDEERARELAQKGLNYDKTLERLQSLESDPRLSFVEQLAQEQGMNTEEFLDAYRTAREQQALDELIQNNIPEDLAQEILESRRDREERAKEKQAKQQEERQQAEAMDFFDYYNQVNDKPYDPKESLPDEVFKIQEEQNIPLKFAYMQYHNQQLQNQLKILKQNEENTKRAPIGGVSTHGSTETASEDAFMQGFNSI